MNWVPTRIVVLASLSLVSLVSSLPAFAMPDGLSLLNVRASAIVADQGDQPGGGITPLGATSPTIGRSTVSGVLGWVPTYRLADALSAGLNIGGSIFKNSAESDFVMLDYEAMVSFQFLPSWVVEGHGGAQTWFSNGGTNAIAGGNLGYLLPKDSLFSEIFVGYSRYFLSNFGTNEGHLGVAMNLDRFI